MNASPDRKPITVAMVSDGIGDVVAGSFISTARFAEQLKARGHRVVFISSRSWRRRDREEFRGMTVHRFAGPVVPWTEGQLYLAVPRPRRVRAILREETVDVVHVMIPMPLGLAAVRVARSMQLPVVVHSHTQPENIFMNVPGLPGRIALTERFAAYLNWLYRQADVRVFPSEFSRRQFPQLAGLRNAVISNGVDRRAFQPVPPAPFLHRFGLSPAKRHLLYLGRLHREKNIETLIRAMPLIVARCPDAHLIIVGRGYQELMLAALARECGAAAQITFCGFVADSDLPAAYAACDLFVLPSMAELEGMVVLEAMACARPLLVADSTQSAATELVNGNGALFRAGDPQHLAEQAVSLLSEPARLRAMSAASLEKSRQFDITESAATIEALYYSLLSSR